MSWLRSSSDGLRSAGISKPFCAAFTEACTSATTWSWLKPGSVVAWPLGPSLCPKSAVVIGGPPSLTSSFTTLLAAASIGRVSTRTAG